MCDKMPDPALCAEIDGAEEGGIDRDRTVFHVDPLEVLSVRSAVGEMAVSDTPQGVAHLDGEEYGDLMIGDAVIIGEKIFADAGKTVDLGLYAGLFPQLAENGFFKAFAEHDPSADGIVVRTLITGVARHQYPAVIRDDRSDAVVEFPELGGKSTVHSFSCL